MADPRRRRSALAALYREGRFGAPGEPRLAIVERRPLAMVQIAAWPETESAVRAPLGDRLRLALPLPNSAVGDAETTVLWLGPGRWLVVRADAAGRDLFAELAAACTDNAAVTEVSDARTCLRLRGTIAHEMLAKGVGIDLHPRAFPAGACAQTVLAHATVLLHAVEPDAIDLYVARSYALHLWEWLTDAAAEFGYVVEAAGLMVPRREGA